MIWYHKLVDVPFWFVFSDLSKEKMPQTKSPTPGKISWEQPQSRIIHQTVQYHIITHEFQMFLQFCM